MIDETMCAECEERKAEGMFVDDDKMIRLVCLLCGHRLAAEQRRRKMKVVPDETP